MYTWQHFADFTWEVIEIDIDVEISFLLLEQSEDLTGTTG